MSRSLYKPNVPTERGLINVSENIRAFYRCDVNKDATRKRKRPTAAYIKKYGRPKLPPILIRLFCYRPESRIKVEHLNYRVMMHTGLTFRFLMIKRSMVGHMLGEFRQTKTGGSRIHVGNRLSIKLNKKMAKLKMEAQQRKNKKKKSKMQIRKERNREKGKAARVKRALQK